MPMQAILTAVNRGDFESRKLFREAILLEGYCPRTKYGEAEKRESTGSS
jgi:hypothetical protein